MSAPKPKRTRKSHRGKQHPLHAESFDRMIKDLKSLGTSNFPIFKNDIINMFKHEAKRVRGIVR